MLFLDSIRYYWKINPVQTAILILSVSVGVAALVAMIQIKAMTLAQMQERLSQLGEHHSLLSIMPKPTVKDSSTMTLTVADIERVAHWLPDIQLVPYQHIGEPIIENNHSLDAVTLFGTENAFFKSLGLPLAQGRLFSLLDANQAVIVLGNQVATTLDTNLENIIGRFVQVGERFFKIIGILAPVIDRDPFEYDVNQSAWIPISALSLLQQEMRIQNMIVYYPNLENHQAIELINAQFPNLFPEYQHWLRNNEWLLQDLKQQSEQVSLMLQVIAIITSIMAMNSLINVTLLSIWQRREEFGIRMAVGATPWHLLYGLLQEAITLSLVGTVMGCVAGSLIVLYLSILWHWTYVFSLGSIVLSSVIAIFLMSIAACYPAYQTIKLKHVELLHAV
jgi:putative ABC transport system permease protein